MVHALEEICRLLKPAGTLIDMHPVAEASRVEIQRGGKTELAGYWSVPQWLIDIQHAESALAEITQRGLFVVEREDIFDSLTHYDSVAELLAELKENLARFARDDQVAGQAVPAAEALAARVEALMQAAAHGAELQVRERIHIRRLMPTSQRD